MSEQKNPQLHPELIMQYSVAALGNALDLITEAQILYKHQHFARAYFLAVASIEETGKAFQALDGLGRDLFDNNIVSTLKKNSGNHKKKIISAIAALLTNCPNLRDELVPAINLSVDITHGREPSMYADFRPDLSGVQVPASVVREKAALDCIRLASDCLGQMLKHFAKTASQNKTRSEDQLFTMKEITLHSMLKSSDFLWFYVAEMEAGRADFADAVVSYHDKHFKRTRLFQRD